MSFGAIIWLTQSGPQLRYEGNDRDPVIMINHENAQQCRLRDRPESDYVPPIQRLDSAWKNIASIAASNIWKARCTKAIEGTLVYIHSAFARSGVHLVGTCRKQDQGSHLGLCTYCTKGRSWIF